MAKITKSIYILFVLFFWLGFTLPFVCGLGCGGKSCVPYIDQSGLSIWLNFNDTNSILLNYGNKSVTTNFTCSNTPTTGYLDPYGGTNAYFFDFTNSEYCVDAVGYNVAVGFPGDYTINMWFSNHKSTTEQYMIEGDSAGAPSDVIMLKSNAGKFRARSQVDTAGELTYSMANKGYSMLTLRRKGTNQTLFQNGSGEIVSNTLSGVINLDDIKLSLCRWTDGATHMCNGSISDVSLFARALENSEILCLYDGSCYSSNALTLSEPQNGYKINDIPLFVYNATGGFNNCSLFHNISGSWLRNQTNNTISSSNSFTFTQVPPDGVYLWGIECFNTSVYAPTGNFTFTVDTVNPEINLLYNNSFDTSNKSNVNSFVSNLTIGLNFTDLIGLYQYEINITYNNTQKYYNKSLITGTNFIYSKTINISGLDIYPVGNYIAHIEVSDSHTLASIGDYDVTKKSNEITYKTTEGNLIKIISDGAINTDTAKTTDRYIFNFAYPVKSLNHSYRIVSNNRLDYQANTKYKGHFVIWNEATKNGNWLDFETSRADKYILTKVSDYEYLVNIISLSTEDNLIFKSIGGLNIVKSDYAFKITSVLDLNVNNTYNKKYMNFTAEVNGMVSNGVNGTARFYNLSNTNYTIKVYGFNITNTTLNINLSNIHNNYYIFNITSLPTNSFLFTILDTTTSALINSNTSVTFYTVNTSQVYYTNTGQLYGDGMTSGAYTVTFLVLDSNLGYASRSYAVEIYNTTSTELTAYLTANTSNVIFTVLDKDTAQLMENVIASQYILLNSSWVTVETKYTDISGRVQFSYLPNVRYQFLLTKTKYSDLSFQLNPVLFSSYDLIMTPKNTMNFSGDYDRIGITYTDEPLTEGFNNFTFIIQSPFSELTSYGFNISYNGGFVQASGAVAQGSILNVNFTLPTLDVYDRVNLSFYYDTPLSDYRDFMLPLNILPSTKKNTTMQDLQNRTYGIGLLDRIIIVTVIILFLVGLSTMAGNPLGGAIIGLFVFGFMVWIGFLNIWFVLTPILLGILLLAMKPEGV